jgi:hypothetical protein
MNREPTVWWMVAIWIAAGLLGLVVGPAILRLSR